MGPDDATPIGPGQVFFAPPGAPLPISGDKENFTPLGHEAEGFGLGMDGHDDEAYGSERVWHIPDSFTVTFDNVDVHWTPEIYRLMFGGRQPKRWRKRFDRHHRQIRKRARAEYRAGQRRRQGIKEKS